MPDPNVPLPSTLPALEAQRRFRLARLRRRALGWRATVGLLLLLSVAAVCYVGWRTVAGVQATLTAQDDVLAQVEAAFRSVPLLSSTELAQLRRTRNARHVELARQLGIEPVGERAALDSVARADGLVRLESTEGYVAWDGQHSDPYVTPSAAASLDSITVQFHDRLSALGLPPYRFTVSSVLRSSEDQADLRGVNVNAAAGRSSHEFATTYDITYRRYEPSPDAALLLPPIDPRVPGLLHSAVTEALDARQREALDRFATDYPSRLDALLGRVLIALEDDGVLVTVRERGQPVYHTTVAAELAESDSTAAAP